MSDMFRLTICPNCKTPIQVDLPRIVSSRIVCHHCSATFVDRYCDADFLAEVMEYSEIIERY